MPTSTGTSNCKPLGYRKNGPAPLSSRCARPRAVASWHHQRELRPSRGALRRGRLRSHRWSSCGFCGTAAANSLAVRDRREDDFGRAWILDIWTCFCFPIFGMEVEGEVGWVVYFCSLRFCLLGQKDAGLCRDVYFLRWSRGWCFCGSDMVFDAALKHFQGDASLLVVAPDYGVCLGLGVFQHRLQTNRGPKPNAQCWALF